MIRFQSPGVPVCLTVTHLDALVLARSGFHHSVNYRSVMADGEAHAITDPKAKLAAMDAFVDRFYPGRAAILRPATEQEIKSVQILEMEIEDVAAKVRSTGVSDEEEDYALPIWCAVLPLHTVIGEAEPCPRQVQGVTPEGSGIAAYTLGRRLDEVMLEASRTHYHE